MVLELGVERGNEGLEFCGAAVDGIVVQGIIREGGGKQREL